MKQGEQYVRDVSMSLRTRVVRRTSAKIGIQLLRGFLKAKLQTLPEKSR